MIDCHQTNEDVTRNMRDACQKTRAERALRRMSEDKPEVSQLFATNPPVGQNRELGIV